MHENMHVIVYDVYFNHDFWHNISGKIGVIFMPYKPPFELTETMFYLTSEIMENLGRLNYVNNLEKLPRLRRVSKLKSIQSSLAIENNSLSLDQVTAVVNGKRVLGKENEILAVKNAFEVYKLVSKFNPFSIEDLLIAHGIMMSNLVENAGNFRNDGVGVFDENGNVVHMAPPASMVAENMQNLFSWLKSSSTPMLIKSCIFHYEFEFIHPFKDGNGRTGRLWHTVLLTSFNPIFEYVPIESIIKDNQAEYYKVIDASNKTVSSTPFIEFMLKCINEAIKDLINDTKNHYNHISNQITDLLSVMESYPMSSPELMSKLNLKSRDNFRNNYLNPALDAGLIRMTEPDKPKSKNQRYYKL